ncbi:MAG TPA: pyruvate kinase [Deltaproteobacteria bacterium]|nr:pyruvate kinase [Deltaproteobacteria bacterium]HQB39357.1 pyruvate kinase [Deltaproteobacteria bacterium]
MKRYPRKTKIVATLGPASSSASMIKKLIQAGADVFRLNFSHGDHEQKKRLIEHIRQISDQAGRQIGILADLQGPKIRTGKMSGDSMMLDRGQDAVITTDDVIGADGVIPTNYRMLPNDVVPGSRVLLDDGLIELKVISVEGTRIHCHVINGGVLKNNKGINLPGVNVSAPSLTEKDLLDLDFALEAGVDFVALSFVRTARDIEEVKRAIYMKGKCTHVVAKIEKPEALLNFKEILKVADGVMVARGDLGVEVDAEKVPLYQKKIIKACNQAGKPVITATQMLESMINNPRPTRAETSDVANAIIDGTDAIMLSAETAAGSYPIEAVRTMANIACDVEQADVIHTNISVDASISGIAQAVAESAYRAAESLNAKAIAVFTQSGSSAALISMYRPQIPVIAFTSSRETQRRLSINWGVSAVNKTITTDLEQAVQNVEERLLKSGYRRGDIIIFMMGLPLDAKGSTNIMRVHKLGTGRFFEIY